MIAAILAVFAIACGASCALSFAMRWIAPRFGLVDRPDDFRKLHQQPIPLGGGLAVFVASAVVAIVASLVPNPLRDDLLAETADLWPLLVAGLVIVVVGLLDDWVGLRGRQKFLGQVLAASILVAGGFSIQRIVLFGFPIDLGALGFVFALFWLVGAINSVNLLDGMDGFAATLGIILSLATALIAAVTGHFGVAILAVVFAGSLAGFLWWNLPPASIFLGDAGSMLIGLVVGTLAIAASVKGPGTVLLAAPLAVWTIPVLDSAAAILRRRLTGRSVYSTDRSHLHHCLLDRFGSNPRVLAMVAVLCLVTAGGALASQFYRNDLVALITSGAVVSIVVTTGLFGRAECFLLVHSVRSLGRSMVRPIAPKDAHRSKAAVADQSVVRLQGSRRWEILWETLVESAEKLCLSRIRFDVNMPALRERFHASWRRKAQQPDDERRWSLIAPLVSHGKLIGHIAIEGEIGGETRDENAAATPAENGDDRPSTPLVERLDQVAEMLDGVHGLLDAVGELAVAAPRVLRRSSRKPGKKSKNKPLPVSQAGPDPLLVGPRPDGEPAPPENPDGT